MQGKGRGRPGLQGNERKPLASQEDEEKKEKPNFEAMLFEFATLLFQMCTLAAVLAAVVRLYEARRYEVDGLLPVEQDFANRSRTCLAGTLLLLVPIHMVHTMYQVYERLRHDACLQRSLSTSPRESNPGVEPDVYNRSRALCTFVFSTTSFVLCMIARYNRWDDMLRGYDGDRLLGRNVHDILNTAVSFSVLWFATSLVRLSYAQIFSEEKPVNENPQGDLHGAWSTATIATTVFVTINGMLHATLAVLAFERPTQVETDVLSAGVRKLETIEGFAFAGWYHELVGSLSIMIAAGLFLLVLMLVASIVEGKAGSINGCAALVQIAAGAIGHTYIRNDDMWKCAMGFMILDGGAAAVAIGVLWNDYDSHAGQELRINLAPIVILPSIVITSLSAAGTMFASKPTATDDRNCPVRRPVQTSDLGFIT